MLLTMKEMLAVAREKKFSVGAFNICDSLLMKTVIEAAEENNAPVIVELAPPEFDYVGEEFFKYVVERLEKSSVPTVLHLDHGRTLEQVKRAVACGFTSVMIDGSLLDYEENVSLTKEVVDYCRPLGISVEAEIGTIGALDGPEGGADEIVYTKPEDVLRFIKDTGADSLAIAIGTAHGIYPAGKIPKLRLDILKEIDAITPVPLVLHGGSSNNDEEIHEAATNGISKVNIASDYRKAFFEQLTKTLNETHAFWSGDVYPEPLDAGKKVIQHKMKLFESIGKAGLYK